MIFSRKIQKFRKGEVKMATCAVKKSELLGVRPEAFRVRVARLMHMHPSHLNVEVQGGKPEEQVVAVTVGLSAISEDRLKGAIEQALFHIGEDDCELREGVLTALDRFPQEHH